MRVVRKNDGTIGKVLIDHYDKKELFYPVCYVHHYERELELLSEIEYTEGTEPDYLEYIEQEYSFGKVKMIHTLGEYQIIEAERDNETVYSPYIKYERVGMSYNSLEEAITGAIAYKYDGVNSQANHYFWKMIK